MNKEATQTSALEMLRARLVDIDRERAATLTAIQALEAINGQSSSTPVQSVAISHEYRGMKSYQAALSYMQSQELREIGIEELTTALLNRGAYLGNEPKRFSTALKIAISQNIAQGKKALAIDGDKVTYKGKVARTA